MNERIESGWDICSLSETGRVSLLSTRTGVDNILCRAFPSPWLDRVSQVMESLEIMFVSVPLTAAPSTGLPFRCGVSPMIPPTAAVRALADFLACVMIEITECSPCSTP